MAPGWPGTRPAYDIAVLRWATCYMYLTCSTSLLTIPIVLYHPPLQNAKRRTKLVLVINAVMYSSWDKRGIVITSYKRHGMIALWFFSLLTSIIEGARLNAYTNEHAIINSYNFLLFPIINYNNTLLAIMIDAFNTTQPTPPYAISQTLNSHSEFLPSPNLAWNTISQYP